MTEIAVLHTAPLYFPSGTLRERAMVVALVMALHFTVFTTWLMQPAIAVVPEHEMEVAMLAAPVVVQAEPPPVQPPPKIVPIKPSVETSDPTPVPVEVAEPPQVTNTPVVITPELVPVVAAAPVVKPVEPVVEPDFKASYLNNRLTYPLAARRMGIQGRVVLNVEVLAEGVSGQINVAQSSGHEMLDRAALESVKTWRFVPARRGGMPFTKWFKVPIAFSLKDNEA